MPALTIPSPTDSHPASPTTASAPDEQSSRSESLAPDRPPVSPINPNELQPAPIQPTEPRTRVVPSQEATRAAFRQQPPPVPISESDNPDAIALRSAISLLQLQREKSIKDLKTLEDLKSAAISDPEGFVRSIQSHREHQSKSTPNILTPTLLDRAEPDPSRSNSGGGDRKDSAASDAASKFPAIPQPQNIIRCPPVNWAKYGVVGEPLDKMHEEQKKYPNMSEPPRLQNGARAPPHAIAAPYSPFTDGVTGSTSTQSRKSSKKAPP